MAKKKSPAKHKPSKRKKLTPKKTTAGRRGLLASGLTVAQRDYLEAVVKTGGNIERSSDMSNISKWAHYEWKRKSTAYADAYALAITEAKEVREATVEAAIREAWEHGWEEEVVEQELEAQKNADGETTMVPVRQKLRKTKRKHLPALLYEGNKLWGNPARLEVTGRDGEPIELRNRATEELVARLDSMAIRLNGQGTKTNGEPKKLNGGSR